MDARYDRIQGDHEEADETLRRRGARRRGRLRRQVAAARPRRSGRSRPPGRRSRPSAPPARRGQRPHRRASVRPPRPRSTRPRPRLVARSRPRSPTSPHGRRAGHRARRRRPTPSRAAVADAMRGVGMSVLSASAAMLAGRWPPRRRPFDDKGYHTENPILAPRTRDAHRRPRLDHRLRPAVEVRRTARSRRASTTAPRRSRASSTTRPAAKVAAEAEAVEIRQAQGDIEAERARLLAEAEAQAEALLDRRSGPPRRRDRRARGSRPSADIAAAARARRRRAARRDRPPCRRAAVDRVVNETLDDATHQALIEDFIATGRRHAQERAHERRTHRRLRTGAVRDRPRRRHARRGRGRAVPLRPLATSRSDALRNALTDEQTCRPSKRQAIVEDLLGGKATATTVQLVSMVVGSGRGRDLPAIVDSLVAARRRAPRTSRSPRSAPPSPLTADQQTG